MKSFIPVNEPLLDGNEQKYLSECIQTGWISSEGPFVKKFEEQFAKVCGRKFGVAVTNGTAALEAAVSALRLKEGDEVILPTFTIISCASAILRSGARPVFVDANPKTWNMNVSSLEKKITAKTKAIMVVHIYGLPVDMDPVLKLAKEHGLKIIEDGAEAIGQTYRDQPCGSFGDLSTFSFYPNKHITTGEGGMLVTDNETLAERCRSLRNLCFGGEDRFKHEELGSNFRMTNLQAAVGLAQLERLPQFIEKKRKIGKLYTERLANLAGIQLPLSHTDCAENLYWVYGIVLDDSVPFDAKEAMKRLKEHGIGTRPFFWPMHDQPVFKKMNLSSGSVFPVADRLAKRGFYIPSGLSLTEPQMDQVAQALAEVLRS